MATRDLGQGVRRFDPNSCIRIRVRSRGCGMEYIMKLSVASRVVETVPEDHTSIHTYLDPELKYTRARVLPLQWTNNISG